ncbi:MAG TPA: NmrA family NAD(P)-binding protein [Sphaerochaeta sp.]|nr:NmrA family NAD(P)-binding protein [Sphaerochaeta sp.]
MSELYFVTGAGGNVGKEVVRSLLERGQSVIASKRATSNAEDTQDLTYKNFDFTDSTTWDACLQGVTKVFLMRPPHISRIKRDMHPFLAYLKHKQIKQIVFLSVQGAETNTIVPHHTIEAHIQELGLPYTFVRPSFFMQNLETTHLEEIRDDHSLMVPTGKGKTNFIDVRDIGQICALMFLDEKHLYKAYTVTGETSYSYREVADHLSRGLGFTVTFTNPNPLRFIAYHLRQKRKLAMVLVMLILYTTVRTGKGNITTDTTQELLQRSPISLDRYIADHKALFGGKV